LMEIIMDLYISAHSLFNDRSKRSRMLALFATWAVNSSETADLKQGLLMTPTGHQGAARSVLAIASSFRRAPLCLLANRFRKSPVKTAVACRAGQSSSFLRQTSAWRTVGSHCA